MRSLSVAVGAVAVLMLSSCGGGGGPSAQDIDDALEAELRSVGGAWQGIAAGSSAALLEFTLQEGNNGQVSGSGTMKESSTTAAVPITVTGTFQRPVLTLTFNGMVFETRQVTGTVQGSYLTVGGIGTTLKLSATGYNRDIAILLQEK
jgi:hypothetical protein